MRRSLALLSIAALGAGALTAPAATAAADSCTTSIDTSTIKVTPRPVVVQAKGLTRQTTTLRLHDSCAESKDISVAVVYSNGVQDYFGSEGEHVTPLGDGDFDVTAYAYFGADQLDNADVNVWSPQIQVYGSAADQADGPTFRVQRAAQLSTNAKPEPVHKGQKLTIKGTLTRADLDTGKVRGYQHQPVALEFRTLKGKYGIVASVVSNTKGQLSTKRTAKKSGCYRYFFSGTKTTAPVTSAADCVKVK